MTSPTDLASVAPMSCAVGACETEHSCPADPWLENALLARRLAAVQARSQELDEVWRARVAGLQSTVVVLRGRLIARDTAVTALHDELRQLGESVPDLASRYALSQTCAQQLERIHQLERELLAARQAQALATQRAEAAERVPMQVRAAQAEAAASGAAAPGPDLAARAVLCVGGRRTSVPVYRHLVERTGGRFLHHGGDDEEPDARLDATLAAADLVVCQTGCISHGAYWRIKDHCKRTGKPCVFVPTASTAGLKRALLALAPSGDTPAEAGVSPKTPTADQSISKV